MTDEEREEYQGKFYDETDEQRAARLKRKHRLGRLKHQKEHDKEKICPYCFEKSSFSIVTDDAKLTKYDKHIRKRNMVAIEWVKNNQQRKAFHYKEDAEPKPIDNGSGVYDKDGKDIGLTEEEVELSPDDQRYVNNIEERIKRQQIEIKNIKKKRGNKK